MTFELNYKEDGDILYGSDLMENLSYNLNASLNFAIDGAVTTNQDNFIEFPISSTSVTAYGALTDTTNTTASFNGQSKYWYAADIIDKCNDGAVNGSWSITLTGSNTGSNEETGADVNDTALRCGWYSSGGGGGSAKVIWTGTNFKSEDNIIIVKWGAPGVTPSLRLYDDDNTTNVEMTTTTGTIKIVIDTAAETADVYRDTGSGWASLSSGIDISSLTTEYRIGVYGSNSDTTDVRNTDTIYYLNRINTSTTAKVYVSATVTADSTSSIGILKGIADVTSGSVAYSFSADSGANYTTLTDQIIGETANTGTGIKFKVSITPVATDTFAQLDGFAAYYS